MRHFFFITHPNVVIDPLVSVTDWPLSELGLQRMRRGLRHPWVNQLSAVYASTERKSTDGAHVLAEHCGLRYRQDHLLGENDRSSTGFLASDEFERVANEFFAHPERSVRGWERAVDAQRRIVSAVERIHEENPQPGPIAIVAHGGVGTLLYCHVAGVPISRQWDQPPTSGGNYFSFTLQPRQALSHWLSFDGVA